MYERIENDPEFINIMEKIDTFKFVSDGKWDWEHGLGHVKRVTNYIAQILTYLNVDDKTLELGKTAGILHDIGLITGEKKGHAKYSAKLAREYLKKYEMEQADIDVVTQAISDHSDGDDIQSIIGAALLLSDKIDVSKYRVINSSIQDYINSQIANINDVSITINDNDIIINYLTNGSFNPNILKDWDKAILSPLKASSYLNKNCIYFIDGEVSDFVGMVKVKNMR